MPLPKGSTEPIGAGDIKPQPVALAKVTDATTVKAYLTTKTGIKATELTKLAWAKPEDIIESAVKLHGATLESYRGSGLGDVAPVVVKEVEPVVVTK